MAARKKSRRKSLIDSIEKELKDLSKDLERRLRPLRREVDKAEKKAGAGTAKLLREARARLNKVAIQGDSDLQKFLRQRRIEPDLRGNRIATFVVVDRDAAQFGRRGRTRHQ